MWLSQREFRRFAVIVSIGLAMATVGAGLVGMWMIYEFTNGPIRRIMATADAAPYSNAKNLQRITQALPNEPTDGREPWLGQDDWTRGVQAGQEYVTQFSEPQNALVLQSMNTSQIWAYMQQEVSGALAVGCQYCHNVNPDDAGIYRFNEDEYSQKIAARNMMRMVNEINGKFIVNLPYWRGNYVMCASCHSGLGRGAGSPVELEVVSDQFLKGTPPIPVIYEPLDDEGKAIRDPMQKPEILREPLPLKEATLFNLYNYKVWKPFDPRDPFSGRGSLALSYPGDDGFKHGGRTQDQANITQGTMNLLAWSLGVGCTYCHNARNFYNYEVTEESEVMNWEASDYDGQHIAPRLKAERMLLMTTYIVENWTEDPDREENPEGFGAIAKDPAPASALVGRVHYRELNGETYNVPGCYTCHARRNIPKVVYHQDQLTDTKLPQDLRGLQ